MSDADTQPDDTETPPDAGATPGTEPTETPAEGAGSAPEPEATDQMAEGEGEQDGEAEPTSQSAEKPKKVGGWQRKIERLERQNAQLTEALTARTAPPPPPAASAEEKPKTQEEKTLEFLGQAFEHLQAQREEKQRQEQQVADWTRRTQEVRAKVADYDDVVARVNIPPTSPLGQALLRSEHGPEIMYQLEKSGELARVSRLHPLDAAREIGKLEAQLASSTATRRTNGATGRQSAAPAPISPVTARGPSNVKPVSQMTQKEFNAWRESSQRKP